MLQKLKVQPRLLILAVLVVALLASSLALQTQVAQAINTPWLTVSGRFIRDPQGNNVELRGVSLVDTAVANTRTRTAIQQTNMATDEANGWYARVVRFPVYPNAIDGTPGWLANPDTYFNNHLNPAIQNCVARQIYCIIDWHYIADYNNSTIDTTTRAFWNYVAPRYANTPNVIYELYNEPINPDNWSTWKTTAQPWVNLIRSLAPNNLILIGGPRWSQNLTSAASDPFVGSNLVYVAHIYPQHGGQSVWDSWFGNAANSVPFFITEWGWQQGGNVPTSGTQSGYGVPFSNYMESKGLSWTAWVHDPFWQPVMFDQSWNLLGGENFMGVFTRDLLFAHRNEGLPGGGGGTNTPTPTGVTATPTPTTPPGGNNTGWVSPSNQASQTGGDGNGFQTSPTSAFADGGTSIATDTNSGTNTNTSCSNTGKDRHAYFAYPLSIPGGSTVTGIEVRLDARVDSATGTRQMCVEVSWNNGATWTAVKTSAALSTTEASYILGSASDTWGRTWSASELTSANFRVRITNVSNSTSRDFF
ncbi:MAG TPA: glycoside hydrolase family 5 protein, partial [Anaerolineae bacterium]|nr:glycoside hydrolase family 5 protein [Anaerolineae bacterium]